LEQSAEEQLIVVSHDDCSCWLFKNFKASLSNKLFDIVNPPKDKEGKSQKPPMDMAGVLAELKHITTMANKSNSLVSSLTYGLGQMNQLGEYALGTSTFVRRDHLLGNVDNKIPQNIVNNQRQSPIACTELFREDRLKLAVYKLQEYCAASYTQHSLNRDTQTSALPTYAAAAVSVPGRRSEAIQT